MDDHDVPAEVAAAWALRSRGHSVRQVAADLGVSVSTAHARCKAAEDAERATGVLDVNRNRAADAAIIATWLERVDAAYLDESAPIERVVKAANAAVRLLERRARLIGTDAPTRVLVGEDREPVTPDPDIVAAVQAAQTDAARRRENIRAGRDRDDDGTEAA